MGSLKLPPRRSWDLRASGHGELLAGRVRLVAPFACPPLRDVSRVQVRALAG